MPNVTFDAVGPSAAGKAFTTATSGTPATWAHTLSGNALLVGITIFTGNANTITSVSYGATQAGAVALDFLGFIPANNQSAGGVALYGKVGGLPTGSNNVYVVASDNHNHNAGSVSLNDVGKFGTPQTHFGSGSSPASASFSTTTGGMLVGVACIGSTPGAWSGSGGSTVRWTHDGSSNSAADNGAMATVASTGSSQAITIGTDSSDWWGSVAVEALPGITAITGSGGVTAKKAVAHGHPPVSGSGDITAKKADAAGVEVIYITGTVTDAATGGWFTDNTGKPRLWVASETWGLVLRAGQWTTPAGNWQSDYDNFFAARAAQGVTVTMVDPAGPGTADTSTGPPNANGVTWDNVSPFSNTNPVTLNNTFWQRIDYMLSSAQKHGITVGLTFNLPYSGVSGGAYSGWTTTQYQQYGAALGARYGSTPNIVWLFGNDEYQGTNDTNYTSILNGLTGAGATQLTGAWWSAEYTSRHETDNNAACTWGQSNSKFNFCYSYNAPYWVIEYAYKETQAPDNEANLLPSIIGDGYFYQGSTTYSSTLDRAVRQDAWWALASGSRGLMSESENVFPWSSAAALSAVSSNWFWANNLDNIVTTVTSLPNWHKLVPDTASTFVTAGRGTRVTGYSAGGSGGQYEPAFTNSYVAASLVADGSLALLYMPNATTITIDQTKMQAGYTATWADPITGAKYAGTVGSTYNSGAVDGSKPVNNSQGDPDWVLILQAPQAPSGSGGLTVKKASASGTGTNTPLVTHTGSGGIAANKASASGSGSLEFTATPNANGIRASKPSLSGTGMPGVTGTGAVTASKPSMSGSGQLGEAGSGGVSAATVAISGSGSVELAGSGSVATAKAESHGSALAGAIGSGNIDGSKPTVFGSGKPTFSGAGSLVGKKASSAGNGTEAFTGIGDVETSYVGVSGTGPVTFTGSGGAGAGKATIFGSGRPTFTGWGGLEVPKTGVSGSAVVELLAAGTAEAGKPGVSGTGFVPLPSTGSGGVQVKKTRVAGLVDEGFTGSGVIVAGKTTMAAAHGSFGSQFGSGGIASRKPAASGAGIGANTGSGGPTLKKIQGSSTGTIEFRGTGTPQARKPEVLGISLLFGLTSVSGKSTDQLSLSGGLIDSTSVSGNDAATSSVSGSG